MRTLKDIMIKSGHAMRHADTATLNNLANELTHFKTAEAEALELYFRGHASLFGSDYVSSLRFFLQAYEKYQQLNDTLGVANVCNSIGNVYVYTGKHAEAYEYLDIALTSYQKLDQREYVARTLCNIGVVYDYIGNYPKAMQFYRRAVALLEELGDRDGLSRTIGNMAGIYRLTGDYAQSLEYFGRALALDIELGNRHSIAKTHDSMGGVYHAIGDHQRALECCQKALSISEELDDRRGIGHVKENLGIVYLSLGHYEEALNHLRTALDIDREIGDHASADSTVGKIIACLLKLGNHEEAAHLLDERSFQTTPEPSVLIESNTLSAEMSILREDHTQARQYLLEALKIATENGIKPEEAEIHRRLCDVAQHTGDFAAYIEHNNQYLRITEEVRGREATQRLTMIEAERNIEEERREREKERALLFGALPQSVAQRRLRGEDVSGDLFEQASVLFLDIVGFTRISDRISPSEVVQLLRVIFNVCDDICERHGLTKIKTIGDCYMAVAGAPEPLPDHVHRTALAAHEMMRGLNNVHLELNHLDVGEIHVRIGLHCGSLVAGIVGEQRLQYDVWGDTVNVASRMESTGEPGKIHVSSSFALALQRLKGEDPHGIWHLAPRGEIEVKGKGLMSTYWLEPSA